MMIRSILAALLLSTCINVLAAPQAKVITIVVHPDGQVIMGRDTLSTDELGPKLQERLWKSYLGTGKMYDAIKIELSGEVLMGVQGSVKDAIRLAQQNALKEICLQKHKRLFENLSASQQQKIKNQFPVLFQEF